MMDIYDPKTNTWTAGPPMPTPRSGLAGTYYKGLFLVLGGELAPNTFAENEAFDPKTNNWRTLAPMPGGRHATNAATSGGRFSKFYYLLLPMPGSSKVNVVAPVASERLVIISAGMG